MRGAGWLGGEKREMQQTLIRACFSPAHTTAQPYVYRCAGGSSPRPHNTTEQHIVDTAEERSDTLIRSPADQRVCLGTCTPH